MTLSYKKRRIDYVLLLVVIIHLVALGGAVEGFMSHKVKMNDFASCILPLTIVLILTTCRIDLKNIRYLFIAILLITILQFLLFIKWDFNNVIISRYYDIIVAFIFARTLGIKKTFFYIETAVVYLTLLSLIIWTMVILFPPIADILREYSLPTMQPNTDSTFGIVGVAIEKEGEIIEIRRNPGFAWEAGRFASIIVLAILINMFRNRFNFANRNFWILFLGLVSTFSTTGFMTFIVCLIGFYINNKQSSIFLKYGIAFGVLLFVLFSPVMLNKIGEVSDTDNWINDVGASRRIDNGISYTPQRVEGLYLETLNIVDSPIIGYGDDIKFSYVRRELFPSLDIFLSNGLLQIIAQVGIPLGLLLYYLLWRSSGIIANLYKIKGSYLFFLTVCLINVSYSFFNEPFIIFIALYSIFLPQKEMRILEKQYV